MRSIAYLFINTIAVFITGYILPGIKIDTILTAFIVAIILGVVNMFLKPVLIILTLPINILTLGLFIFIINGVLILLISALVPGFFVKNIWWAILFSLVVSLISSFLHRLPE
ncbi:MAG: phage holin family protein [bacterium]|nr:phage holin family protein [bacterium]